LSPEIVPEGKLGDIVTVHGVIEFREGRAQMTISCAGDVITETDAQSEAACRDH